MEMRDEFFHAIRRLLQEHTARWQGAGIELTKAQYAVLRALDEQPGCDQASLGELSATAAPTLVELLARMEQRGLLERRPDPRDGRRRTVWLTRQGEQALATARAEVDALEEGFMQALGPRQRAALTSAIRTMLDAERAGDC